MSTYSCADWQTLLDKLIDAMATNAGASSVSHNTRSVSWDSWDDLQAKIAWVQRQLELCQGATSGPSVKTACFNPSFCGDKC